MLWLNSILVSVAIFVSSCGFQPLYSPQTQASEKLSLIKIETISDRRGQILRNHLLDILTPYGEPSHPEYRLKVVVTETRNDLAMRPDGTAKRTQLHYNTILTLTDVQTKKVILKDNLTLMAGFPVGSFSEFSSIPAMAGEDKARMRAMEILAYDIKSLLASYLANLKSAP